VTVLAAASALGIAMIVGLAFALPCAACRKRRERMQAAYDQWKGRNPN
jgi:hypothetical protein